MFNTAPAMRAVQSHLAASGYFQTVQIGEPLQPPPPGITVSIEQERARIVETTANAIEVHTQRLRVYMPAALTEPRERIELEMADAVAALTEALVGDFNLGGAAGVRNIDVAGQYGRDFEAEWLWTELGGTIYRTVEISVPVIVNGDTAFAAT